MRPYASNLCVMLIAGSASAQTATGIPFQGCPSDGQMGPVAAPRGIVPVLSIPPTAAAKLAWYKAAYGPGILAPRGWHCFSTYGANGSTLYVSPETLIPTVVFTDWWQGFSGPAVEISSANGGSVRFMVAHHVARLFPAYMEFTRSVIAERIGTEMDFPQGPFPQDKITYKAENLAEFETPANSRGQGTQSRFQPSDKEITGFVFVSIQPDQDPSDVSLEVRLPTEMDWFAPVIRSEAEQTLKGVIPKQ